MVKKSSKISMMKSASYDNLKEVVCMFSTTLHMSQQQANQALNYFYFNSHLLVTYYVSGTVNHC